MACRVHRGAGNEWFISLGGMATQRRLVWGYGHGDECGLCNTWHWTRQFRQSGAMANACPLPLDNYRSFGWARPVSHRVIIMIPPDIHQSFEVAHHTTPKRVETLNEKPR